MKIYIFIYFYKDVEGGGFSYTTVLKFHYIFFWTRCTAAILSKLSTVCSPLPLNGMLHSMLTEILKRIQLIVYAQMVVQSHSLASNGVNLAALCLMTAKHKGRLFFALKRAYAFSSDMNRSDNYLLFSLF